MRSARIESAVFHAPPGAGPFEALRRDIERRAFDLARSLSAAPCQGVTVVQLRFATTAQIRCIWRTGA